MRISGKPDIRGGGFCAKPPRPALSRAASSARTRGITSSPKYFTSSLKCRKASSARSTPTSFSATMRSAIWSGVPIRLVLKPSLYWTRSSKVDFAQLPSPSARPCRRSFHLVAEGFHGVRVGVVDDLLQDGAGLLLGLPGDDEGVDADLDRVAVRVALPEGPRPVPARLGCIAIREIPVGDAGGRHVPAAREEPPWKITAGAPASASSVVAVAIEVAAEGEVVLGPDPTQRAEEFFRAAIALVVVEPGLADGPELAGEPARDEVDGDAPLGQFGDRGDLLGGQRRVPRPGRIAAMT